MTMKQSLRLNARNNQSFNDYNKKKIESVWQNNKEIILILWNGKSQPLFYFKK